MTPTRRWFPVRPSLFAAAVALASCRGGCHKAQDRAATVEGRLALFPAATRVVAAIDASKLRGSPAAGKLAALAQQSEGDRRQIEEFAARTGFDPLTQLDSLTVAFPEEARAKGELGLVMRAQHLDEARLVAYVRDQLQKSGDDLVSTRHGRFTLWSSRRDPSVAGFFVDGQTFVLGGGGWGERMADLAETPRPSDSAATNVDLVRLVERAAGMHAIWAAAIVPEATRRELAADPASAAAAGVLTMSAAIDLGKGIEALLLADLATAADAQTLATRATEALRDAKRNAQVLMLGLGPYLDGVTARANARTLELHATLNEAALDDVLARLKGLLALVRGGQAPGFGSPVHP
jgi:hypothetical protein